MVRIIFLCLYVALGIVVYFGSAHLLKLKETYMILGWLKKPVKGAPQENEMKTAGDLTD